MLFQRHGVDDEHGLRQLGGRLAEVLEHPRYRLHIVTSRGRGLLQREGAWRTPLGYAGAFFTNADTLGDYVLVDFLDHRRKGRRAS